MYDIIYLKSLSTRINLIMKKTCTPLVLPYGTITGTDAGMGVATLHLAQSNSAFQLPDPLTSKNRIQQQRLRIWHA